MNEGVFVIKPDVVTCGCRIGEMMTGSPRQD